MKRPVLFLGLACAALGLLAPFSPGAQEGAAGTSAWWRRMGVRDLSGAPLDPAARWFVVVFMGEECPVSNESIPVLNKLSAEFGPRGFAIVGAFVDSTADLATLRAHAADFSVGFPAADDREHRLVEAAKATYTPEVAVFTAQGVMLYRGRIDDRVGAFGAARPAAAHEDLRDTLLAIAGGATGPFKGSQGFGCAIPEPVQK